MKKHYYKDDIRRICQDKHLTAEEVFASLCACCCKGVWKSSIYRNLEEMVVDGELKKVVWVDKKAYFETNTWSHIHLIDTKTGEIVDLPENVKISNLPKNFKVNSLDIKVFGSFS
jgi:Fe2+ or Zn2+ uptake regulation protein